MEKKPIAIIILCFMGAGFCGAVQSADTSRWETIANQLYSTRHGLPNNHVEAIYQDPYGYLWFATQVGTAKYDGSKFTIYDEYPDAVNIYTRCLCMDYENNLWVGTLNGIFSIKNGQSEPFEMDLPGAKHDIASIVCDPDGVIWFVCNSEGPYTITRGKLVNRSAETPMFDRLVRDLVSGPDGWPWVASTAGIFRFSSDGFIQVLPDLEDTRNVESLCPVSADSGWFACNNGTVYWFDDTGFRKRQILSTEEKIEIYAMTINPSGGVWIGTSKGMFLWEENRLEHYMVEDGLASNQIMTLLMDQEGLLWYGSDNGVGKVAGLQFRQLRASRDFPFATVTALESDSKHNIWVGTAEGLVRIGDGVYRQWTTKDGLPDDYIASLMIMPDDSVLVNTSVDLSILRNNSIKNLNLELTEIINDTCLTQNDEIWLGTSDGLRRLDGKKTVSLNERYQLPPFLDVITLFRDSRGDIWLTSYGAGAYRYDAQNDKLEQVSGLPSQDVFGIYEDSMGQVWFGTVDGAIQLKNEKITFVWTEQQGMASSSVWSILEDRNHSIWLATSKGLSRVKEGRIINFDTDDGLSGDDFLANCTLVDEQQRLWFGGSGITIIDTNYTPKSKNPRIYLERASVDDKLLKFNDQVPHNSRVFEFEFVSPTFANESRTMYRYQLIGFDSHRSSPTKSNIIRYTLLPTGKYQLEAQSMNRYGEWSDIPYVVSFEVLPAWWEHLWVQLVIVCLALSLIYVVFIIRSAAIQRRARWLQVEVDRQTSVIKEQVTALEDQKNRLQTLAITDDLTGLHNRRHFFSVLTREWKRHERYQHPLSIILLDIDHFKEFNDTYGHAVGDHVLMRIADVIRRSVRETDTVARFGGEEFIVLLPETNLKLAFDAAERIRTNVDSTRVNITAIGDLNLQISGGVSCRSGKGSAMNPDGLVRQADEALYRAKQAGRNIIEKY